MPTSKSWGKTWLDAIFTLLDQRGVVDSVLDVGAGRGTFSMRLREAHPGVRWTAVEAWEPYLTEFDLEAKYDRVVMADARSLDWGSLGHFAVAFLGDVLEHMTKEEAIALVEEVSAATRFTFLSIPLGFIPQGAWGGNPYEEHIKPDWSHEEVMTAFPQVCAWYLEGFNGVYALAESERDIPLLELAVRSVPAEALGSEARVAWIGTRTRPVYWWVRLRLRRARRVLLGRDERRHRRLAARLGSLALTLAGRWRGG